MLRAAEILAVLRPAQPPLLIGLLAKDLALRAGTILLPPSVAVVGNEKLPAMQAFAAGGQRLHRAEKASPLKATPDRGKPEQDPAKNRTEKEEKKRS
jgi:hypothetical protein